MFIKGLRLISKRNARGFANNHSIRHVEIPETAMLTNNGTHEFVRKGWEYSTYMGFFGGPLLLWLGISNAPETDSEVFAREEAYAKRKGHVKFEVVKRPTGPIKSKYAYEKGEIGERPSLQA